MADGLLARNPSDGIGGFGSTIQPVAFISSYHNFLIEPRTGEVPYEFPSPLDLLPGVLDEGE